MTDSAYHRDYNNTYGNLTVVQPFGWDEPGVRGYVYGNSDNTTLFMVFKGTSITILGLLPPPDIIPTNNNDKMTVTTLRNYVKFIG